MTRYLERLIVDCTCGLFKAYGVSVEPVRETASAPALTGPQESTVTACLIKLQPETPPGEPVAPGKLLFLSSFAFVAKSRPPEDRRRVLSARSAGDWIYIRDWTRELTNQLAGRITNRLAGVGAHFSPCLPLAMTGSAAVRQLRTSGGGGCVRFSSTDKDEVDVLLDVPVRVDGEPSAKGPKTPDSLREGSIILFEGDDDA